MKSLMISLVALMAAPALAQQQPTPPVDPAQQQVKMPHETGMPSSMPVEVRTGLQATIDRFARGWNAHDPRLMANEFATDGHLINPMGAEAEGRAEIENLFRQDHQGPLKSSQITITIEDGRMLGPDTAFVDVSQEVTGMQTPDGQRLAPQLFHASGVLKRQADRWVFVEGRAFQFLPPPGQQPSQPPMPAK